MSSYELWHDAYMMLVRALPENRQSLLDGIIEQLGQPPPEFEGRILNLVREPSPPPFEQKRNTLAQYPERSTLGDDLLTLNKIKFTGQAMVSENVIRELPYEVVVEQDRILSAMVLKMKMSIFGKQLPDEQFTQTERIQVPATSWQYWKWEHKDSRWWGWVAKRWPVRKKSWFVTVRLDISRALTFPELTTQFPQHPVVQVLKNTMWDPTEFFE